MTYGAHLAAAADALARAHAALKRPTPDAGQRALAALARAGIYRSLEKQTVLLSAERMRDLPPDDQIPLPAEWHITRHSPATNLAISLRQAPACTMAVGTLARRLSEPTTAVAVALTSAESRLRAGTDLLVSNVGPRGRLEPDQRPHTTDGMALLAGVGRADSLALVARLAQAIAELDQRLARWLWPEDAPRSLQPLLAAAEEDAWRTKSGSLRSTAILVSAKGKADQSPFLDLTVAPLVDDPRRWTAIAKPADCVAGVDAARSWLLRQGEHITAGQLVTISRATAALIQLVSHIQIQTTDADPIADRVVPAVLAWRGVTEVAAQLRSAVHPNTDHTTATVALTAATGWLRDHLRSDGAWIEPPPWNVNPSALAGWRQAARDILARLPDLADLTAAAVGQSRARDNLLATTDDLDRAEQRQLWKPALPGNVLFQKLRDAMTTAAREARELASAADVTPRPGLAATAANHATRGDPVAVQLARQWYTGPPLRELSKPPQARPRPTPASDRRRRPPRLPS